MNTIDMILQSAKDQLASGSWSEAYDTATIGLRFQPDNGVLHQIAGVAAYHREEYGAAVFHLETASALIPLAADPQLVLAKLYWRFGLPDAARAIIQFLAEPDRCPVSLLPEVAKQLGCAGDYQTALDVCERLTRLRPTFHPAWFGVAYYRGQLGRPLRELEAPLRQAFALAPHVLPYRLNLAAVLIDTDQITEGYELIAGLPPDAVECPCQCRRFARVCIMHGDEDQAAHYQARADQLAHSSDETAEFDFTNDV